MSVLRSPLTSIDRVPIPEHLDTSVSRLRGEYVDSPQLTEILQALAMPIPPISMLLEEASAAADAVVVESRALVVCV